MDNTFTHFSLEIETTSKKSFRGDWEDVRVFATRLLGRSSVPIDQCWVILDQHVNNLARFETDRNFTLTKKGVVYYFNPANIVGFCVYKK